jgi:hypothetical protein
MASAAQERANRPNAARSTGPRTEAGKEKTKFNALRHELTSAQFVLWREDKENLEELRRQFHEEHQPVGKTEKPWSTKSRNTGGVSSAPGPTKAELSTIRQSSTRTSSAATSARSSAT